MKTSITYSINIKKQFRGKNLSNEILVKSEKFLQKGLILLAEVKKKNVKSKKTFISGDYIEYNSSKNFIEYFKLINKSHSNQVAKISKVIKDIEAVRKNFTCASGNITDPISLPSATRPGSFLNDL